MNILVISCIHNDIETLLPFLDRVSELSFDVIVSPGDFTDSLFPKGFSRRDVGILVLEELRSFNKPVLVVPGSWDKELVGLFVEEGVSLHGVGKIIDKVGFYGYGGAKTPFGLPLEPTESELEGGLLSAYKKVEDAKIKVQVTHIPPHNTKVDVIASGAHVGSQSVRRFIENNRPDVAICSHIHEARGIDVIGTTKIINSGRFPEGYCGLISITEAGSDVKVVGLI